MPREAPFCRAALPEWHFSKTGEVQYWQLSSRDNSFKNLVEREFASCYGVNLVYKVGGSG